MSGVDRVREALLVKGLKTEVQDLPSSTRTAAEAAATLGCEVAQIAKSIVFEASTTGRAVLVIASGVNRVDEKLIAELLGEKIKKASAEFVLEKTGFVIGGVSPVGSLGPVEVFFDKSLFNFDTIWAAAGSPFSVFKTTPTELQSALECRTY